MRTAIVTGASKGIGEAIVNKLLLNDYKVYGISRSKPNISNDGQFVDFEWEEIVKPDQISEFLNDILSGKHKFESGVKKIIATDALSEDFEYDENLYGYNTSTKKLSEI